MSKINFKGAKQSDIPIPKPGSVIIFADVDDSLKIKYKTPDGLVHEFGSGGIGSTEWQDSVKSIITDLSAISPNPGDKYLIGDGAVGQLSNKIGQIMTVGVVGQLYSIPSDGTTIRVDDDDNAIYLHNGDYDGTYKWIRQEFYNDVLDLPSDGTWEDGVFNLQGVRIVDAFDVINKLLTSLVPPKAPPLSDWSAYVSNNVTGRLSFDQSNPIPNYFGADLSQNNPFYVDDLYPINGKVIGIIKPNTSINGTLNHQVTQHTSFPTPAYVAKSFGDADKGYLKMYVNDTEIVSAQVDLSDPNAIDTTVGGTVSGISVSQANPSKFPQGDDFTQFINRTGTWRLDGNDAALRLGYNHVRIEHDLGDGTIRVLDDFEFVIDGDTTPTAFSNESLNNITFTGGLKYLSGIAYYKNGLAYYDITIDNLYRNTYNPDIDAVSFQGVNMVSAPMSLPACLGDEAKQIIISSKEATISPTTGLRLLNGDVSLKTKAKRTVQQTSYSNGVTISSILLDNFQDSSDNYIENFDDENYRLPSNHNFDDVNIVNNLWDSLNSIKLSDGIAGYDDGLQVVGGMLIYPGNNQNIPSDFSANTIQHTPPFNDGGTNGSTRDYSSETNIRNYIRFFQQVNPSTANFRILINGDNNVQFVDKSIPLTGNKAWLEIKLPTQTGWLDCYKDFTTGNFDDGDGARNLSDGSGGINNWLGLTVGTKSTAYSNGLVLVKITVSQDFVLGFDSMILDFI